MRHQRLPVHRPQAQPRQGDARRQQESEGDQRPADAEDEDDQRRQDRSEREAGQP